MPDRELQEELERRRAQQEIRDIDRREEYSDLELKRMRKAVKREYGPDWRRVLGLAGMSARSAIVEGFRSLRGSKGNLERMHAPRRRY